MKHYLRFPSYKLKTALLAGAKYDRQSKRWYIEEPLTPPFILEDFAAWKIVSEQTIEARQKLARSKKAHGGPSSRQRESSI